MHRISALTESVLDRLRGVPLLADVEVLVRRFFAQGMMVYSAALAYRGLLAMVPFALFSLALIALFGVESDLPHVTAVLERLRGQEGDYGATTDVPLGGILSAGAAVGFWSMATGARLFMRAMNTVHGVTESRMPLERGVFSIIFLPTLAGLALVATVLLLTTGRLLVWLGRFVGLETPFAVLGGWLRMPLALMVVAGAVTAAFRYGPSVRPPMRAVAAGAGVAVVLWAITSFGFGVALYTVLDYGTTYGAFGAAVAVLVYLHASAVVLLFGAQVSAVLTARYGARPRPRRDRG